jgi:hypothetical protein
MRLATMINDAFRDTNASSRSNHGHYEAQARDDMPWNAASEAISYEGRTGSRAMCVRIRLTADPIMTPMPMLISLELHTKSGAGKHVTGVIS